MKAMAGSTLRIAAALSILLSGPSEAGILGTKHDMSARASISMARGGAPEICIFCHTPHVSNPAAPVWNLSMQGLLYTPYSSSTLQARPGQPNGDSKLCLSCHDGTIALGGGNKGLSALSLQFRSPRSNLTTDLSDDHPISFYYDFSLASGDAELASPDELPDRIYLDEEGRMQCTSCHDAHEDRYPDFLVMDNAYSALCTSCHRKRGWAGSTHEGSSASWSGAGVDPWPYSEQNTVASNGCSSCHTSHASGSREWLLYYAEEEENCLSCHSGTVARKDIASDIRKPYRHPVESSRGLHDPLEDVAGMPRHVECHDCHDPHATMGTEAKAPFASGALEGVTGVHSGGGYVKRVAYEFEVCFRCHADASDQSLPLIERQVLQPNIRLKFDPAGPSFHPVVAPGTSNDVPSLIFPLTEASQIYCSDCHASDDGPGTGGGGASGPHGSIWPFLLEREYRIADGTPESFQVYALCYKCHERSSIVADESFPSHSKHLDDGSSCAACHDPHGISATQGNSIEHSHLINFDVSLVRPDTQTGLLRFEDLGNRKGRCYLECHGRSHSPEEY